MFTRSIIKILWITGLLLLLATLGCSASQQGSLKVRAMADDIARNVGTVQRVSPDAQNGPLFIFEEYHTSRVGQLQIAVMLLRLHDKYGLKKIGLEGATYTGRQLDAKWFHNMGGASYSSKREDLIVRMLAEGEISSAESMALAFPDVEVYGIENADEYAVKPSQGNPEIAYLLAIAEQSLSDEDGRRVNDLIAQGRQEQAIDLVLNADPWVKKQYDALKSREITSSKADTAQLLEIQKKASEVGAQIEAEDRADLEQELKFYQTATKRSATMAGHVLELPNLQPGAPVAMIIGAAHTEEVIEALNARNISFAVVRPIDLNPKYGNLSEEQFERKLNGKWAQQSPGTLGQILNGVRKQPPIIERATTHAVASMHFAGILLAEAARAAGSGSGGGGIGNRHTVSGGSFPDDIWPLLAALPEIRIDRKSIKRDGYDVIYLGFLKQDDGSEIDTWGHVGTTSHAEEIESLELKILKRANDLKMNVILLPSGGQPQNSQHEEEGIPGDQQRNHLVISRTSARTLAVYGRSQEAVKSVGQISD